MAAVTADEADVFEAYVEAGNRVDSTGDVAGKTELDNVIHHTGEGGVPFDKAVEIINKVGTEKEK